MKGFKGDIICTAPTIDLVELILTDSAYLQQKETERYNKTKAGKKNPIYPIYGQRHVEEAMARFKGYDYDRKIKINQHVTITLKSAGHLLGACSPYIEVKSKDDVKRVLFTGDTSADKIIKFTKTPDFKDLKVDLIVSEGTYGDRLQKENNVQKKLKANIKETCLKNNGQLMIPVFAVGRSSLVLAELFEVYKNNPSFHKIPIYLASPMAVRAHKLHGHDDSFNFYNKEFEELKYIFDWEEVNYIDDYKVFEKEILNSKPKIILSASGMISGGYSSSVASNLLPNNKNTILFCGYQGIGCAGRHILESKKGKEIKIDGKEVERYCNVDMMSSSSHADYKALIRMYKSMRHTKIKQIILVHGNEDTLNTFKEHIEEELNSSVNVEVADYNKTYSI